MADRTNVRNKAVCGFLWLGYGGLVVRSDLGVSFELLGASIVSLGCHRPRRLTRPLLCRRSVVMDLRLRSGFCREGPTAEDMESFRIVEMGLLSKRSFLAG